MLDVARWSLDVQRRRHRGTAFALCLLLAASAPAAEPELKHVYPPAGQQGSSIAVSVVGKSEPWPPQVWIDSPGITFTPTPITGTFHVDIAPDAKPGPHLIRLFNEDGATAPRFFIVSAHPELRETEPNDEFKAPQQLQKLPASVSGRLRKGGDVDCFSVPLSEGQTVVAWAEAYVLGSTCDAFLRIVDREGRVLAFNHDGRTLDPFLAWTAPRSDTFIVQLMAFAHPPASTVQLAGGDTCIYRLHLTTEPLVRFTVPLAARAGMKNSLRLVGWNLAVPEAELEATPLSPGMSVNELPGSGARTIQPLTISGIPEVLEAESAGGATIQTMEMPSAVTGRIARPGDEDRFSFTASKQRVYDVRLTSAGVGSPLDAWLRIEDASGKELARSDDAAGSRDPQLIWTAPADGTFILTVGELTHRGGDEFIYRLALSEASPSVTASVATHAVVVQPAKPAELKVAVKRAHGFKPKLQVAAKDLPGGVSCAAVEVPEKDGEVTLKLTAESGAQPCGKAFRVVLRESEGGKEHPVLFRLSATSEDNGVPQGFSELIIDTADQLWVTVKPDPPK